MDNVAELANNLAGAAALVNGLILWPIVRALQRSVNELKADRVKTKRKRRTR